VVLFLAAALGAVVSRRALARIGSSALSGGLSLAGYGAHPRREPIARPDLLKLRHAEAERNRSAHRRLLVRLLERIKAEHDRHTAGAQKEPPVLDILVVSGGGDWGAFGAGFLKGWHKVPAQHALAKPEFDIVTGVSTGTLIAPFAFLGDEPALDQIVNLYRNPVADCVKPRGRLYFLPDNISLSEVPGLERELRRQISMDMVRRIAKAGADPLLRPLWLSRRRRRGVGGSRRVPPGSCSVSVNRCPTTTAWRRSISRAARPTPPCWRRSA